MNDKSELSKMKGAGSEATDEIGGSTPLYIYRFAVLYYVLHYDLLNYSHFQVTFSQSAFRTPPLNLVPWTESHSTLPDGVLWNLVSTQMIQKHGAIMHDVRELVKWSTICIETYDKTTDFRRTVYNHSSAGGSACGKRGELSELVQEQEEGGHRRESHLCGSWRQGCVSGRAVIIFLWEPG